MSQPWSLFENIFFNAVENSAPKAIQISTFHHDALFADSVGNPFILGLYTPFNVVHQALLTANDANKGQDQLQQGDVEAFNLALADMTTNVNAWDANAQIHYAKGTARYKALFPNGHSPFLQGSQQARMTAVGALLAAIGSDAALTTLKGTIQTYYNTLTTNFSTKGISKTTTTNMSAAMKTAVTNMCALMLADYGSLLTHFSTNPQQGAKYFDEATLRNAVQTHFTGSNLKPLAIHNIIKRKLDVNSQLKLSNNGDDELKFYLAASYNGAITGSFVHVAPHNTIICNLNDLGDENTMQYLNVYNVSATLDGSWALVVL